MLKKVVGVLLIVSFALAGLPATAGQAQGKMNFISIAPFFPHDIEYTIAESRRLAEASGVRKNAYSMTLQPDGTDVYAKPKLCAEAFRKICKGLEHDDIECGILIQSTVGHGWAGAATCELGWSEIINIKGITLHRLCMLDPNFREYIRNMVKMLAAEKPAFFLVDDDLRAINNSSNGPECFCDLHMAEFNRRTGRNYTREQLIEKIKTGAWNDPDVVAFEQLRRETVLGFAKFIRDAIDEVDPSIRCGYCSGGGEYLLAGDIARTLAGKGESFLRINNAAYMETWGPINSFYNCMYQTAFKVSAAGALDSILDESDIYPHNLWSKSATSMHAHITGGLLHGVSGGKLWISDRKNKCDYDVAKHRAILREHIGFYDTLLGEVGKVRWFGPNGVLRDPAFQFHPGHALQPLLDANWHTVIPDPLGLPSHDGKIDKSAVNTLTADVVNALSDDDIRTVLSGKALVDGTAALKLAERGFAKYLGVEPQAKSFKTTGEWVAGCKFKCPLQNTGCPFLANPDPKAEILSEVRAWPYHYAAEFNYVMPGAVYFENELGGKVVTTALGVNSVPTDFFGRPRKMWAVTLLRKLDPESLPLFSNALQNVYSRCGLRPDGGVLGAICNIGYDKLDTISLTSSFQVKTAELLQGDGSWKAVDFKQNGDQLEISKSVSCQEFVIFKLAK
ncbi:MAG: hypothetical protein MJ025_01355 [Victivallaceae bacterium]|nr:hypothetical protein [Victivallaceae bacterium]